MCQKDSLMTNRRKPTISRRSSSEYIRAGDLLENKSWGPLQFAQAIVLVSFLLGVVLFVGYGVEGIQILSWVLLCVLGIGMVLALVYVGHFMTRKTISEVDVREYRQGEGMSDRTIAALVQVAGRSQSDAIKLADLMQRSAERGAQQARRSLPVEQYPQLPLSQEEPGWELVEDRAERDYSNIRDVDF